MNQGTQQRILWLAAWLVLLFAFLIVLRPPSPHLDYDVGVWTLCARDMNRGAVLYQDAWDHKGPLIFLLFAAVQRLFGYNPVAINSLAIILMALVAAGVYCLAWQLFDRFAAGAAVTFLLLASVFPSGQRLGPELMMEAWMVPAFIATIAGLRRQRTSLILVGGVLAGLAFQVHGVVGMDIMVLLLGIGAYSLWVTRRSIPGIGGLLAVAVGGLMLPAVGFSIYFYHLGALADYWNRWIVDNLVVISVGEVGPQMHPAHRLGTLIRGEVISNPVFWIAALCGALLLIIGAVKRQGKWQEAEPRWQAGLLICWLIFGAMGVALSGRYYPHYLMQMLPAGAVLAGVYASHTYRLLREPATHHYSLALVLAVTIMALVSLFPRVGPAVYKWKGVFGAPMKLHPGEIAGNWLKGKVAPGASVFAWGFSPQLYLTSDTKPVNRFYDYWYFQQITIAPPSGFRTYLTSIWQQDLNANPPQYVFLQKAHLEERAKTMTTLGMDELLGEEYVKLSDVASYEVYRQASSGVSGGE